MTPVGKLLRKMRRLWMLERFVRFGGPVLGAAASACLLCGLLHRTIGLSTISVPGVAAAAAVALAGVLLAARARAPSGSRLARQLDERAGSSDLFASALEFGADPARFGRLGRLTCDRALAEADRTVLHGRWSPGPLRHWAPILAVAALLGAAHGLVSLVASTGEDAAPAKLAAKKGVRSLLYEAPSGPSQKKAPAPFSAPVPGELEPPEPAKPPAEAVKITNEMIDRYLRQIPDSEPIDLEGVTPIRWDDDDLSGKANPQDRRRDSEKIDPVKLDAALLKDLQAAKKDKAKGGGKDAGGVDIAVIGKGSPGPKAKGTKGGKGGGSLADAVSKDPRGKPTRLAVRPVKRGLPIRSAARSPVKQPGQVRPMGLLEFLAAMRRVRAAAAGRAGKVSAALRRPAPGRVVHQESVPDAAAGVVEAYFGRLRKAER